MKKILQLLEQAFRHGIVYPLFRLLFRNPPVDIPIDIRSVRKLLILRYDRIGDIIVTTPVFRALKKANPSLFIGVLASESNAELISHNPNVDRIYTVHSSWLALWKEIRDARTERYDVVLNLIFNRTTSGGVLANMIAPRGIKIGQGAEKYRFYFNALLKLPRGDRHMVEILAGIVKEVFHVRISSKNLRFELPVEKEVTRNVERFVKGFASDSKAVRKRGVNRRAPKRPLVVVNISATDEVRKISRKQALEIVESVLKTGGYRVAVVSSPGDSDWRDAIIDAVNSPLCRAYPAAGVAPLKEVAALIGAARAVITPDTSIVHIASAMQTPVMGLFTPLQVTAEWLPYNVKHRTLFAQPGKPVSALPAAEIQRHVALFLKGLKKG